MPTSVIAIQIDETTLDAIQPFAITDGVPIRPTAKPDLVLAYDLKATATGFPKQRVCEGPFTIIEGVTP